MNAAASALLTVFLGVSANAQTLTTRGQDPVLTNAQQDHKLDLLDSLTSRLVEAIDQLTPRVDQAEDVCAGNARRLTVNAADLDQLRATLQAIRGEVSAARALNDKLNATVKQCVQERDGYYRAYVACTNNPPCPTVSCPPTTGRR
ncbi:hypothetical protein [Oceanibaculum pacificum]|uniref:Uncharacterized protein n=1 Tax=Oceanibaculum pacificum TaxID=580166 RepID=A0A154WG13_9PROT|nr:hypothetical protein [Oceanibaculum pacificum]KZD12458.1 hypothetical protein AUP43_04720 [Oceanibaculum pacificum]